MILDTTACAIAQDGAAEQMDAVAADQKSCEVTQILIRALARIVRKTRGEHGLSVIHGGTAAALAIELRAVIFVRLKIQDYRVRIGGRYPSQHQSRLCRLWSSVTVSWGRMTLPAAGRFWRDVEVGDGNLRRGHGLSQLSGSYVS